MSVRVPLPYWVYGDDHLLFRAYYCIIKAAHSAILLDEARESLDHTDISISDQALRAAVMVQFYRGARCEHQSRANVNRY